MMPTSIDTDLATHVACNHPSRLTHSGTWTPICYIANVMQHSSSPRTGTHHNRHLAAAQRQPCNVTSATMFRRAPWINTAASNCENINDIILVPRPCHLEAALNTARTRQYGISTFFSTDECTPTSPHFRGDSWMLIY